MRPGGPGWLAPGHQTPEGDRSGLLSGPVHDEGLRRGLEHREVSREKLVRENSGNSQDVGIMSRISERRSLAEDCCPLKCILRKSKMPPKCIQDKPAVHHLAAIP